jgi:peptidoglycan hydrolase-like protein with peptidoglycan-binding domain
MKKSGMILVALSCLLTAPATFAAESSGNTQGAATMQQGQKAGEQNAAKKTSHRMSAEDVKAIQDALNAHGAKLTADGKWSKQTREAIKAFQKENGLKPTGRANRKTRKKLGLNF